MTHTQGAADWLSDFPDSEPVDLSAFDVTAVLVSRNGAAWLPDTLAALARLTRRPDRIIAVDQGSDDETGVLLREALTAGTVSEVIDGRPGSFADGARLAMAEGGAGWWWFLHDDVVCDPDALERMLALAASKSAVIISPMLLRPTRRRQARRISELGSSVTGTGRRWRGLEPGEIAQGQRDPSRILGASTCGLLVRADVFSALGGFDAAVPCYRDGVDLGWRANLAGYRVMSCPEAHLVHRQAGRSELRSGTVAQAAGRSEIAQDRLAGMILVAAHTPAALRPWLVVRLVVSTLLRTIGLVLGKAPWAARDEVSALAAFLRSRSDVAALHRRVDEITTTPVTRAATRTLRPSALAQASHVWDRSARWVLERFRPAPAESTSLDELTGDDFAGAARRQGRLPLAVWVVAGLILLVVAARGLIGTGVVTSTELLPGPTWLVVIALALTVVATTLAAAWFLRPLVSSGSLRWTAAIAYGLIPVLLGGAARGQLWLLGLAVCLPLFGVCLRRWETTGRFVEVWQPAAAAALLLAAIGVLSPVLWVPAVALLVVCAVRAGDRSSLLRAAVTVVGSLLLVAGWLPGVFRHPGRLVTGPEPLLAATGTVPSWQVAIGRSAGAGLPPLWLSAAAVGALWLAVILVAMLSRRTLPVIGAGVGAVAVAVAMARVVVPIGDGEVRPQVAGWLLLGFGLLAWAVVSGLDAVRADLASSSFGLGQSVVATVSVVSGLSVLLAAGWWVWGGLGAPLHRGQDQIVPVYVDAFQDSGRATRTLVIALDQGSPRWSLVSSGHPRWGDGEQPADVLAVGQARQDAESVVAHIAAGRSDESIAADLEALGVGHVAVTGADADELAIVDSIAGLQRASSSNGVEVWLMTERPSRYAIVDGTTTTWVSKGDDVPAGSASRVLVVSQEPVPVVSVGGTVLAPAQSGDWRPAYAIGSASGTLVVDADVPTPWWLWAQLAWLVVLVLFALPSVSRPEGTGPAARRAGGQEAR